jgi:uncharacterized protein
MKDLIIGKIEELAADNSVRILYACESGSRAWGFPSPDSDYDVRFIYANKLTSYLSLHDKKDTIDVPVNPVLDINGWDIRKSLKLFTKSNGPLYEWLQSPIVYKEEPGFRSELTELFPKFYSLIAGYHHYFSMARNVFENDLSGNEVKLKKYFYALRPLLACQWIIHNKTVPPMEFSTLRILITDNNLNNRIDQLLDEKKISDEKTSIKPIDEIQRWILKTIGYCEENYNSLSPLKYDIAPLDSLFIKYIS